MTPVDTAALRALVERLRAYSGSYGGEALVQVKMLDDAADAIPALLDEAEGLQARNAKLEDLVERARHLAACVFKGSTKADDERARHNAAVLANAIDHEQQSERNRAALGSKP